MAEQNEQSALPRFQNIVLYKRQPLGIGSFGKVVKARCDELPCNVMCAAKMIHETLIDNPVLQQYSTREQRRLPLTRFERECDFLRQFRHPNIVQYLGMGRDPDTGLPVLLMELMEISLNNFVKNSRSPIHYCVQVNICHDIAQALTFLHSNKIVHRDLSSNNVLLDRNQNAKVADFGMAKFGDINSVTTRTMCPGADDYMPPEAVESNPKYTEKIDCFSFGVIALQILTRKPPAPRDRKRKVQIKGVTYEQTVSEIQRRKEHIDEVPPTHELLPIIKHCLEDKDTNRPSAKNLCDRLATLKLAAPLYIQRVPAEEQVQPLRAPVESSIAHRENTPVRHRVVLSSHNIQEENTETDARPPVPVQEQQHEGIPILNAPQRRVAPGGNGLVHQPHHMCCSSWMIIISLVVVAILAYQHM
jgi:serine/threonine protein kinase